MKIASITGPAVPIDNLAANASLTEAQKVGELSRQFEAVLLRQILGQAQKPVFKSKFRDESVAGGIYQDLTVNQLADQISQSGDFGVARSLNSQLLKQVKTT